MNAHDWSRGKSGHSSPTSRKRGRDAPAADSTSLIQRKESCACGGTCPSCQAKSEGIAISRPGDASEVEADRIADRVVRGESVAASVGGNRSGAIARAAEGATTPAASPSASAAIRANRGTGQALDAATRATMGQRFGQDLDAVRVHNDSRAAELSEQLNARAFTVGNDIYFGRGRFDPASADGTRLLAHELTHVVQQRTEASALLQRDIDDETETLPADSMPSTADELGTEQLPALDEAPGEEADTLQQGGRCNGESNRHFLLANSVPFEFTVPSGCRAIVTFSALWVPVDTGECCTGADTYTVTRNGGRPQSLPAGANICEAEHVPRQGTIRTGSGRQRFNVQVDRRDCTGVKLQLDVNIRIR